MQGKSEARPTSKRLNPCSGAMVETCEQRRLIGRTGMSTDTIQPDIGGGQAGRLEPAVEKRRNIKASSSESLQCQLEE